MSAAMVSRGAVPGLSPARAAWQAFANHQRWWTWTLLAALLLGVPALASLASAQLGWGVLFAAAELTLCALWGQLVSSTLYQNHPGFARLVPDHARRLRMNLVLVFAVLCIGCQLAGYALHWSSLGLCSALALAYVAAAVRWPLMWAGTGLIGFAPLLPRYLPEAWREALAAVPALLSSALGFACLVTAGALFLASLVKDGGAAHQAMYEGLQRRRRTVHAGREGEAAQTDWFGRLCSRGYLRSFERVLARVGTGRVGFEREMLALGPRAHLSSTLTGIVVMTGIVGVVLAALELSGVFDAHAREAGAGIANSLFGLLGTLLGSLSQLHGSVIRRRHEQALVVLLPGVPRGSALNRSFARALLQHYLVLWGLGSAAMTLLLGSIPGTGCALLAFCTALLLPGLVLLRDWSRATVLGGWTAFLVFLPATVIGFGGRILMEKAWISPAEFLAFSALLLVSLYAWRWRAVTRAPTAWPAGRCG
jgi:hypothetical protein